MIRFVMQRCMLALLSAVLLSACAGNKYDQLSKPVKASSFAYLNSYDMALRDYKAGKVMEARARILAMDAKRDDYKQARILLKNKINPARIRLLRHYKAKGKKAEKSKLWAKARGFYFEAAAFSAQPEIFLGYAQKMDLSMRKDRLKVLRKQRLLEDAQWQVWQDAYEPPKGVAVKDDAFMRQRKHVDADIEARAIRTFREARHYLRKDMAGVAFVEAESYLRLKPDSEKGYDLMQEVRGLMPKVLLKIVDKGSVKAARVRKPVAVVKVKASRAGVLALMKKGEWLQARKLGLQYRRSEGKGADKLLKDIDMNLKKAAAVQFSQGLLAFRHEHIDEATKFWQQAVLMQPENMEYVDARRRAMQLQEHLHLLRSNQ
ncbi:MAG: hypothetical protein R8K49_02310 [Mariprofundaceae bacterium]